MFLKDSLTCMSPLRGGNIIKIMIICKDFRESNLRKQPWKYLYEIGRHLEHLGHEVTFLTNNVKENHTGGMRLISVRRLFIPFIGEPREVLSAIERENPDICIMNCGLTTFLRAEFVIQKPTIGILTSPIYSFEEILRNVGIIDTLKELRYTVMPLIHSLVPRRLICKWADAFHCLVVLTERNRERFVRLGVSDERIVLVPPGLDERFRYEVDKNKTDTLRVETGADIAPIILYFTSPVKIRGTETLIEACSLVNRIRPCRLRMIMRDEPEIDRENKSLMIMARRKGIEDSVKVISKNLSPEEIALYLSAADVVCLPFKIVLSEGPISVLEALAIGKPLITTEESIPTNKKGIAKLMKPGDAQGLADNILELIENEELRIKLEAESRDFMKKYPTWEEVTNWMNRLLVTVAERNRR
jgi:phosphatidyl-myo-inositol dimannoside synthase